MLQESQVETALYRPKQKDAWVRSVSLNLAPLPEVHRLADARWEMGYRVPGVTVRF